MRGSDRELSVLQLLSLMMENQELCFPELLNASCKKPTLHWADGVLVNMLLSFISMITTVLNLLVIISVSHFRRLHTPTNILLLSLAVSDFLVGFLLMPIEIFIRADCWFLGDIVCSVFNCTAFVITSSSVGDMVLISVDRYVAICDPLHYATRVTERRVKLCVCVCWLCSVFYSGFLVKEDLTHPGKYNSCYGECRCFVSYIAGVVDLILTFIAPITVIVVLYIRVFVVAVSQAQAMHVHASVQASVILTSRKSELKAARTLGVLVIVFLICFCPYYCLTLTGDKSLSDLAAFFVCYLFYFNSCLNPVIYAMFYPWFRKAVKLIVTLQILQPGSCDTNIL